MLAVLSVAWMFPSQDCHFGRFALAKPICYALPRPKSLTQYSEVGEIR